jgi:hypothetical protein
MGRGKTVKKAKTVNMKRVERGERGFGWAPSADSEPQTHGGVVSVLFLGGDHIGGRVWGFPAAQAPALCVWGLFCVFCEAV